MSFTLVPKYGETREVNVWVWRPTLELIRDAKLIDEKSYKKMGLNDGVCRLTLLRRGRLRI